MYQTTRDLNWILKYEANSIVRDNAYFFNRFGLMSEWKLAHRTSLNTSLRAFRQSRRLFQSETDPKRPAAWQLELAAEPRWHWSDRNSHSVDSSFKNPFVGNYVGARAQLEGGFRQQGIVFKTLLTFGSQSFYYTSPTHNIDNSLDANMGIGLAFSQDGKVRPAFEVLVTQGLITNNFLPSYRKNNRPPKRVEENSLLIDENRLFKIDLFNLFAKVDEASLEGELNLAFEQKIGKSPFSLNLAATVSPFLFVTQTPSVNHEKTIGRRWAVGAEPRWYYDLNKRMRKGESDNNLFGSFFATEFLYQNYRINRKASDGKLATIPLEDLTITPLWGVQQRLSPLIFYDFRIGWGIRTGKDAERRYFDNYQSVLFADVLLGVAF